MSEQDDLAYDLAVEITSMHRASYETDVQWILEGIKRSGIAFAPPVADGSVRTEFYVQVVRYCGRKFPLLTYDGDLDERIAEYGSQCQVLTPFTKVVVDLPPVAPTPTVAGRCV